MVDFTKSFSQSNPIFGRCIYAADQREIAEDGYVTPLCAIECTQIEKGEMLNVSADDIAEQLKYFVNDLIISVKDLDQRITIDSKGRRRAFMFVTVPGNAYLRALKVSDLFNKFITENEVGVYITSSPINFKDKTGTNEDYFGGGYIKKPKNNYYEPKQFNISDFIKILNNKPDAPDGLGVTDEEIYYHMNILVNIDQCNTGVNLPALNGVYIAKYLDENNPLSVQIPGRICRADSEDCNLIGNKETSAYTNNCQYVKPYGYIYIPVGLFTEEEFENMHESLKRMYYDNSLIAIKTLEVNIGLKNPTEPDNSDKIVKNEITFNDHREPNWKSIFEKLDLLKTVYYNDIDELRKEFSRFLLHIGTAEQKHQIMQIVNEFIINKEETKYNLQLLINKLKEQFN